MDLSGRICWECGREFPYGEFQSVKSDGSCHVTVKCRSCVNGREALANKQLIAKASKEFLAAMANAKASETADIPVIIERFKEKIGGVEKVADMLFEDFQRVRGADLPPEERAVFAYKEQVIQKYHQLLLKAISDKDEQISSYDLSSLSDDDLRSVLAPIAAELARADEGFRSEIMSLVDKDSEGVVEGEIVSKPESDKQ